MENKVLIELYIPNIDLTLDLFIPINKKVGNILTLINKALYEIDEEYKLSKSMVLYNRYTSRKYDANELIAQTDIRSGTALILI